MEVGLRVVRGKDWKWGDQDGGEGGVGTLVEVGGKGGKLPRYTVAVVWDGGVQANYRTGRQGADDLRVLDSASVGVRHRTITCDVCKDSGVLGTRWKCEVCFDFDLCHSCYMGAKHDLSHAFTRWDTQLSCGVKVPSRASSARKVSAKGIYIGSKVVRGRDWGYKDQDGGADKPGVVQSIGGSNGESSWRSWAKVKWDAGLVNDYRRGHKGKIDVRSVKAAPGETYYVDHLSSLGEYASTAIRSGGRVKVDESKLSAEMKIQFGPILGRIGKAVVNEDTQELLIKFPGQDKAFPFSISFLMKAKTFRKGDIVTIEKNSQTVINLQQKHGGWNEQMKSCLGQEAEVTGLDSDGDVKVRVGGRNWILNPDCCTLLTRATGKTDDDDDDDTSTDENDNNDTSRDSVDITTNFGATFLTLFLDAMLKEAVGQALGPDMLVKMAAEGKLDAVQLIIKNHPGQMDFKVKNLTALQVAAHQGHLQVAVALANAGARLDAKDNNGDNVLHFAVIGNQPAVLEVLLKHRPLFANAQNEDKRTCLHLAVIKQHATCVQLLLKYNAEINMQDKDGETALHMAFERPDAGIQDQLINLPKIDFKLKNEKGFNVIHQAAIKDNENALRKLIPKAPTFVNVSKSDGFTALHICTINGHKNSAEVLISMGKANMEMKNLNGFTPLLLAVNQGQCSMIEFLIGKGADVNAEDKDGDTALHLAVSPLRLNNPLSGIFAILNIELDGKKPKNLDQSPAIAKVMSDLPPKIQQHRGWIAICCYLLQNGASLEKPNHSGKTVGGIIGDGLKQLFTKYIKEPARPSIARIPAQSVSSAPSPSSPTSTSCMRCQTAAPNMKFYPCEHKVICSECSRGIKECPKCHAKIQEKVKSSVSEDPREEIPTALLRNMPTVSNNAPSMEKQRRSKMVGDTVKCPLCEMNDRNVVFLCGHSCCKSCSDPLTECHVCCQVIERKLTLM